MVWPRKTLLTLSNTIGGAQFDTLKNSCATNCYSCHIGFHWNFGIFHKPQILSNLREILRDNLSKHKENQIPDFQSGLSDIGKWICGEAANEDVWPETLWSLETKLGILTQGHPKFCVMWPMEGAAIRNNMFFQIYFDVLAFQNWLLRLGIAPNCQRPSHMLLMVPELYNSPRQCFWYLSYIFLLGIS